jgi:hypothetical protein
MCRIVAPALIFPRLAFFAHLFFLIAAMHIGYLDYRMRPLFYISILDTVDDSERPKRMMLPARDSFRRYGTELGYVHRSCLPRAWPKLSAMRFSTRWYATSLCWYERVRV